MLLVELPTYMADPAGVKPHWRHRKRERNHIDVAGKQLYAERSI
jgi:hypothetical protein